MKHSMVHNAVYNTAYQLLNVLFPLVSVTYAARILSPEGMGRVAYAQNTVSYFVMFAVLGISDYGLRETARFREDRQGCSRLCSELLIINTVATAAALICYAAVIRTFFAGDSVLHVAVGLELAFNFLNVSWLYQGLEEYRYITLRSGVVKVLSLAALFLFVKDRTDYVTYALIHSLGIGCNYCFNMLRLRHHVTLTWKNLQISRHLQPIFWLMMSVAFASLYQKVDISMLGAMGNVESVAYYTNAHKIIGLVLSLVMAVSAVFLPRLSYVYRNEKEKFSDYITLGLKIILVLAVPVCLGIQLVAEDMVLVLFGQDFAPCADVLRILAAFSIIKGIGDILCYQVVISSGNEHMLIWSRVGGAVANVLLNALLIPRFGHNGAAVASVISEIVVNGMLVPKVLKIVRVRLPLPFVMSVLLSSAGMVLAVRMVQRISVSGVLMLILSVGTGVILYLVLLLMTGNEMTGMLRDYWRAKACRTERDET